MESAPLIYTTIIKVLNKVNAIAKNNANKTQGFKYRGIDDVMNELHGAFAECGLFVVPEVLSEERTERQSKSGGINFFTRQKIKYTFYAADGSNINTVVIGEAMDSGDKASNKALSIAFKYACLQVFCIPTDDEDKDPDRANYEVVEPPKKEPAKKYTAEDGQIVKEYIEKLYPDGTPVYSEADKNKYRALMVQNGKKCIEVVKKETEKRLQSWTAPGEKPDIWG